MINVLMCNYNNAIEHISPDLLAYVQYDLGKKYNLIQQFNQLHHSKQYTMNMCVMYLYILIIIAFMSLYTYYIIRCSYYYIIRRDYYNVGDIITRLIIIIMNLTIILIGIFTKNTIKYAMFVNIGLSILYHILYILSIVSLIIGYIYKSDVFDRDDIDIDRIVLLYFVILFKLIINIIVYFVYKQDYKNAITTTYNNTIQQIIPNNITSNDNIQQVQDIKNNNIQHTQDIINHNISQNVVTQHVSPEKSNILYNIMLVVTIIVLGVLLGIASESIYYTIRDGLGL